MLKQTFEQELAKMPRRGDAVLSRDGTVKLNGVTVGFWERGNWAGLERAYLFTLKKGAPPVANSIFRHTFKADISRYLVSIGRLSMRKA